MYTVEAIPAHLRSKVLATDFTKELKAFREKGLGEFRVGISRFQKTPHCYETYIFDWDFPFENAFWGEMFGFIEDRYIENGNVPREIKLRPQLIHYPREFGGLGTHIHDSSVQKVGVICVLSEHARCGSFYIDSGKQIFFANEGVGDVITFDFSLSHGVLSVSRDPEYKFDEPDYIRAKTDLGETGRLVAVLTSE